jgi:hypothetical protein
MHNDISTGNVMIVTRVGAENHRRVEGLLIDWEFAKSTSDKEGRDHDRVVRSSRFLASSVLKPFFIREPTCSCP